jgi:hypothetical protein
VCFVQTEESMISYSHVGASRYNATKLLFLKILRYHKIDSAYHTTDLVVETFAILNQLRHLSVSVRGSQECTLPSAFMKMASFTCFQSRQAIFSQNKLRRNRLTATLRDLLESFCIALWHFSD